MPTNTLTATSIITASPAEGAPVLNKLLTASGLAVSAPLESFSSLGQVLQAGALTTVSPALQSSTINVILIYASNLNDSPWIVTAPGIGQTHVLPGHSMAPNPPIVSRILFSVQNMSALSTTADSPALVQVPIPGWNYSLIATPIWVQRPVQTPVNVFDVPPLQLVPINFVDASPWVGNPEVSMYGLMGGDMRGLPQENLIDSSYYRVVNAIWPDLLNQTAIIAPPRNGMNRDTGKMLQGWDHVEQSMRVIFATPYHERVMRRWVGAFVPLILGRSTVPRIITRFFWAIAVDLEMNEPNYRVKQVYYMGDALNNYRPSPEIDAASMIRLGQAIFREEGVYRPRAHLGDYTPFERKAVGLISRGNDIWDITAP